MKRQQAPAEGDAPAKSRRTRWTPSEEAKSLLETIFSADSFPTFAVRSQLAEQLGVDTRQIQIWFQNRRQRERQRTEGKGSDEGSRPASQADDCEAGSSSSSSISSGGAWPAGLVQVSLPRGTASETAAAEVECAGKPLPERARARRSEESAPGLVPLWCWVAAVQQQRARCGMRQGDADSSRWRGI